MVNRRERLQDFLNEIEPGWRVYRPWKGDIDDRCVFQNREELKEACADIPQRLFEDGEDDQIRRLVRRAISSAVVKFAR